MKNECESATCHIEVSTEAAELLRRWQALSTERQQRCIDGVGDMAIKKPHGCGIETSAKEPSPVLAEALLAALARGTRC